MAAIEEPEAPEVRARAGERVAMVIPVVTRLLRRLLRRSPEAW